MLKGRRLIAAERPPGCFACILCGAAGLAAQDERMRHAR